MAAGSRIVGISTTRHRGALRFDQPSEVAVAGKQHHLIDVQRHLHRIDRKLDIHVAFDLAPAGLIDEFPGRLGDDGVAVVVEPMDQRPDGRILPDPRSPPCDRTRATDSRATGIRAAGACNRYRSRAISRSHLKIGAVNEQSDFFGLCRHDASRFGHGPGISGDAVDRSGRVLKLFSRRPRHS